MNWLVEKDRVFMLMSLSRDGVIYLDKTTGDVIPTEDIESLEKNVLEKNGILRRYLREGMVYSDKITGDVIPTEEVESLKSSALDEKYKNPILTVHQQ